MLNIKSVFSLFGDKKHIGLDLGALCLKVCKLEKVEGGLKLLGMGVNKVPDTLGNAERSLRIQSFLQQNNFIPDGDASVNIEDPTLLIRRMDLPKMPERDLKTAIRWNFREFVTGSVDDYIISYLSIKMPPESEKMPLSAFCIARRAVDERQTMIKNAGLKVASIEPNATALLNAFNYNIRGINDKYYVVLDLGNSVSNFIVVGNGCLLFSRPLGNLCGKKLVEFISKGLLVEKDKAEEGLKSYLAGIDNQKVVSSEFDFGVIGDTVSDFISKLIVDVQRSIDAFCIMYKKDKVDKMYLCGGGVCLPDIVNRLSSSLGVEVEIFNPFQAILDAENARKMKSAPMYAVAVGLAIPQE